MSAVLLRAPARTPPPTATEHPVDALLARYARLGAQRYDGEAISQLAHALQSAHLAEMAAAPDTLIAAALLHDVGHLLRDDLQAVPYEDHATVGARWLGQWFGPAVTEPIRLHAHAKRYLIATSPGYGESLTPASLRSLSWQGAALTEAERRQFLAQPFAREAIELRRWDDRAKNPSVAAPPLTLYRALLEDLFNSAVTAAAPTRRKHG